MSEAQMRSAEEEIEEKEITESKTEEIAEQDGENMQEEKKTGFLSRETLYSKINISLKSMDRFIAILIILLIVLLGVGIFS